MGLHRGALRDAILDFKFRQKRILGKHFGELLAIKIMQMHWEIDLYIPVPMSPNRNRERGFNPAGLIAERVALILGGNYAVALETRRELAHQLRLGEKERRENVRDAFALKSGYNLEGKSVLIVDDVTTTGATLSECGKAIRKGNPLRIQAATIALEERKEK